MDLKIDLVVKIINEYPMDYMNKDDLNKLDYICEEDITDINYFSNIKKIKNIILQSNSKLTYFIDNDENSLNIKINTYKQFNDKDQIRVKRAKDMVIKKDIFSF